MPRADRKSTRKVASRKVSPSIDLKPKTLVGEPDGNGTIGVVQSKEDLSRSGGGQASSGMQPIKLLPALAAELQGLQRQRAVFMKSRMMNSNRLLALVAGPLGYHAGMEKKERTRVFTEAATHIKAVEHNKVASNLGPLIITHLHGIREFEHMESALEKEMVQTAKQLPVAAWVEQPEQRGFGILSLAIVVGETGDLANYANPAKVWRRLGCAPWTFDGKTLMGCTWKSGREGKLPAEEWEMFGYSPRRRSIAYLIGEGIVKQNFLPGDGPSETGSCHARRGRKRAGEKAGAVKCDTVGPYRLRYDQAKALFKQAHPEHSALRCHRHGMLLATKLLLRELWCEWNGRPIRLADKHLTKREDE